MRLGRSDFAIAGTAAGDRSTRTPCCSPTTTERSRVFRLGERLRPEACAAIAALQEQGITVLIASGDTSPKVASIAARLNVGAWRARALPADKLAWLTELRAGGARVLAVGDGINDAPVLAGADVAIALAEGAELAQASSDIVLMGARLDAIAPARELARQTLAIVRQNQRWAMYLQPLRRTAGGARLHSALARGVGNVGELAGRHPERSTHRAGATSGRR